MCRRTRTKSSVSMRLSPALVGLPMLSSSPKLGKLSSLIVPFQSFPPSFHELTYLLHLPLLSLSLLKTLSSGSRVSLAEYGLSPKAENAAACEKSQANY